jgi:tetratricopeptide (TPR) repeat protein
MQNFAFAGTVFLFVTLTSVIVFQQHLLQYRPRFERTTEPESAAPAQDQTNYLDLELDARSVMLLDALQETPLVEVDGEDMPMNGHWIKQAAHHILQAERAERDNMPDLALVHYEMALKIFPDLRGIHPKTGVIYMERRQYEKAIAAFEKAAREGSMSIGIANNLGAAYLQVARMDRAEEVLLQAVALQPDYAPAHFNLATLYLRQNELENAAASFQRYQALAPDNTQAMLSYALVLIQLERWPDATLLLEAINEAEPSSPPVLFRLAQTQANLNQQERALATLKQAVALVDPRNALAWMSRTEFDPLRSEAAFQQLIREISNP